MRADLAGMPGQIGEEVELPGGQIEGLPSSRAMWWTRSTSIRPTVISVGCRPAADRADRRRAARSRASSSAMPNGFVT